MANTTALFESHGRALNVTVNAAIAKDDVLYINGFAGIAGDDAESGETIALLIEQVEYTVFVGTSLAVSKGDTIYVTTASVTADIIPQSALSTTSGAGKKAFLKATEARDSSGYVRCILLPQS